MSRRCRHPLADLAHGSLDADGCLVCPWHSSRYDVRNGRDGRRTPRLPGLPRSHTRHTQLVLSYGRILRLRVERVLRCAGRITVE